MSQMYRSQIKVFLDFNVVALCNLGLWSCITGVAKLWLASRMQFFKLSKKLFIFYFLFLLQSVEIL